VLQPLRTAGNKKADAVAHPKVLSHVGLLVNGPPAAGGLPFI
jgi:hypothetical protein